MRISALAGLFLCTSMSAFAEEPLEKPKSPMDFSYISGAGYLDDGMGHYCYLGAAYLIVRKGAEILSASPIWNFEKERPYTCEEFRTYIYGAMKEYREDLDAYREVNPLPRTNPR